MGITLHKEGYGKSWHPESGPLRSFKNHEGDSIPVKSQKLIIEECKRLLDSYHIDTSKYVDIDLYYTVNGVTMLIVFSDREGASIQLCNAYFDKNGEVWQCEMSF